MAGFNPNSGDFMLKYLPLFLLVACGKPNTLDKDMFKPKTTFKHVREPAFESYFKQFEDLTGISTQDVSTKFQAQKDMLVGTCHSWSTGEREIQIAYYYWEVLSELEKQNLIFHEAGHCSLNLGHDDTFIEQDNTIMPRSIMYPYLFGDFPVYEKYLTYYHEELKSHVVKN